MFVSSEIRRLPDLTESAYGSHFLSQAQKAREIGAVALASEIMSELTACRGDANVRAGFSCLAAAQVLDEAADVERALQLYRYAGDILSSAGFATEAAVAYERAGDASLHLEQLEPAIRLFARSKKCFADAGDNDSASCLYVKEEDAKSLLAWRRRHWTAWARRRVWRLTCFYGERFGLWAQWVGVAMLGFAVVYEFLHRYGQIGPAIKPWLPFASGLYLAVVTTSTLGYGDYAPEPGIAQGVVVLNLAFAYLFLGIGIAVVNRRIMGR